MILALDYGNSQITGGIFQKEKLRLSFRKTSRSPMSSDELGIFLKSVLRENDINPEEIKKVALCTVVPEVLHTTSSACLKYFKLKPFILKSGVKTGLDIKYKNPREVGADRIANAIAGCRLFPQKNLIIIDFGTATTFCAISKNKEYLGGLILPGPRLMMETLQKGTAQLPSVEIVPASKLVARSTVESIQSGIYFGNRALVRELSREICEQNFSSRKDTLVIGTGGFSKLYKEEGLFDEFVPELPLRGLYYALEMNL